jgi:AcrR family transcriptional regulator
VRQSHLTYYFRTRNDLLKAVVEEGCSALLGMIWGDMRPGKVTLAKFRDALLSLRNDQSMPRLLIALTVASDEDPALNPGWRNLIAAYKPVLPLHFGSLG